MPNVLIAGKKLGNRFVLLNKKLAKLGDKPVVLTRLLPQTWFNPTTSPLLPKPFIPSTPVSLPPKTAYSGKPALDHPWRKAIFGKAKFGLANTKS
jgi:hypothetical protein